MTKDEAVTMLKCLDEGDNERAHAEADEILLEFLRTNGYEEIADAFEDAADRITFWYA